jgi:acyl-coenzyme A synthetase/AMP-(fatty) acid ligase
MYHVSDQLASNYAAVGAHSLYITTSQDARSVIDNIRTHSITVILFSPHIMEGITAVLRAESKPCDALKSLRDVTVVGSVARPDALVEFRALLPNCAVLKTSYGSTEVGYICLLQNPPSIPGYVGTPAPGVEVQ